MQQDNNRPYIVEPSVQAGSPQPDGAPASVGSAGAPSAAQIGGAGAAVGTGLTPNVAGALSYFLGPITGVIFVLLDKNDRFVRFHAFQSILLSGAWIAFWVAFDIVSIILGQIPLLGLLAVLFGLLLSVVLGLGGLVLWIALMVMAYQGKSPKLPVIGVMAERYAAGPVAGRQA
jgi:uncharacterized membrane protein